MSNPKDASDLFDPSRPVLITGVAGFIGSHVAQAVLARGGSVAGVDNFDPYYDEQLKRANLREIVAGEGGARFNFHEADITDQGAMEDVFRESGASSVVHLAAKAGVRPSIEDPVGYAHANVTGTSVVLRCAERAACGRIVVASSSSVYGSSEKVPFAETDDITRPISPYAATKLATEAVCCTHAHLTGMPTACLRFFTVYGPRQRPDLAIRLFMRKIAAGEPIPFFGDGSTSRDYTYIDDIVSGVLASLERAGEHGYRVWNLGSDRPVTLRELVETIGEVVGRKPEIERKPMQPGDVPRTWADLTRAGEELGYRPTTKLREGLERQHAWMRSVGECA